MMRVISGAIFILFLISSGTAIAGPQSTAKFDAAVKQVRAAEQKWLDAYYRLDVATLQADESDRLTLITPSEQVNKQGHLEIVRKLAARGVPTGSSGGFDLGNQRIDVYGDTAIVSDVCNVVGKNQLTSAGRYWQTEVWHYEEGKWKIVHFHISMLAHRM
jgi:ketosteroid isomerase-like protein